MPRVIDVPSQMYLSLPVLALGEELIVTDELLCTVPLELVTEILPLVAPEGTVTLIEVDELIVKSCALLPSIKTEVTPDNAAPVTVTVPPTQALDVTPVILGTRVSVIVLDEPLVLQLLFVLMIT